MIRWKYALPRLVLLLAASVMLGWGIDPLLRRGLSTLAERLVGARVDIDRLETTPLRGTLSIDGLAVGDANREARNVVEFERATLDVEMSAVLRRKLVVRDGQILGLRFNTDRDDSGRLGREPDESADRGRSASSVVSHAAARGEAWFQQQLGNWQQQLENDLQTVRLARRLGDRWSVAYEDLEQRAELLEQQSRQLRDRIAGVSDDPLQHLEQLRPLVKSIEQLRHEVLATRDRLNQLQRRIVQDRRAIESAKQHDVQYVRERLRLDELDGRSLTEYLLGPTWSQRIETAANWLRRSRQALPADQSRYAVERAARGVNVIFPGFSSSPNLLVRQLEIQGHGRVDREPFAFSGVLRSLTHQPARHAEPATFELHSRGAIELTAYATLDRRFREPIDRLVVDVPALRQGDTLLGDPSTFSLAVAPGVASIHADVSVRGDELSGRVTMRQDQVQLTLAAQQVDRQWISPASMAEALAAVERLDTEIELTGTLTSPRYELRSNLGRQLADGLNRAAQRELARREQQLIDQAQTKAERELTQLQDRLATKQSKLMRQLDIGDEQLGQLGRQLLSWLGGPDHWLSGGRRSLLK